MSDRETAIQQAKVLKALIGIGEVSIILNTFISAFIEKGIKKPDGMYYLHGNFNLNGPVSGRMSSCVAPWTMVLTQRGLIRIDCLQIADYVWTHKRRWRPITMITKKPIAPMVEVLFSNGYTLTCKKSHKLNIPFKGWQSIKDIQHAGIKKVDFQSREHIPGFGGIPSDTNNCNEFGKKVADLLSQYTGSARHQHAGERIQGKAGAEIFPQQTGRQEPYEGEDRRGASQLHRGLLRWKRLFNQGIQRQKNIFTSCCLSESSWLTRVAHRYVRAPYRWRPSKQRSEQSCAVHKRRTQNDSHPTENKQGGEIKTIHNCGNIPVWDITVEEDHSYWAEGCFHHNSNPNMQNLPVRGRYGKTIKTCFAPPPGWLFAGADFSSLEDRISALTTKDPNKLKVYTDGYDGHCLRAHSYFHDQMVDIPDTVDGINSIEHRYPKLRQDSKMPTFALTYQGTWHTLVNNLGLIPAEAKEIEKKYHELYVVSDDWIKAKIKQASKDGFVTGAFGLRLRTPILEQTLLGKKTTPYESLSEGRTAGNMLGQSYGLLNNRAAIEFQRRLLASPYKYDIKPIAHIHDAQYFLVRNQVGVVEWFNKNLVACMQWQELPEIKHPDVHLGGSVELFHPNWSVPYKIKNGASKRAILETCNGE